MNNDYLYFYNTQNIKFFFKYNPPKYFTTKIPYDFFNIQRVGVELQECKVGMKGSMKQKWLRITYSGPSCSNAIVLDIV